MSRSPSFKVLLSSLLVKDEDEVEENAMLSKAERRLKRRKQGRSLDSMPTPNDNRFSLEKPTTNDVKRGISFGGKNNTAVAVSPSSPVPNSPVGISSYSLTAPSSRSNTRPSSPREIDNGGGDSPYSTSKIVHRTSTSGSLTAYSQNAIKGLHLQQNELRLLKQSFDRIDEDKNGIIDKLELLHALGDKAEETNLFVDKVFDVVDDDGDEGINFDEFIQMAGTSISYRQLGFLPPCTSVLSSLISDAQ